jgi:uncharacterized protein (TIGR02594 family)
MIRLSLHSRGHEVQRLQLLLDHHLPPPLRLKADGRFGRRTCDAVTFFQRSHRLRPDGVVGENTWRALGVSDHSVPMATADAAAAAGAVPWMAIAIQELGIHRDQVHHQNQRIIAYLHTTTLKAAYADTDSTAWCSAFVNWVLIKAGKTGTNNALAASWLNWKAGKSVKPSYGAVTVIRKQGATSDKHTGSTTGNHVGFCVSCDAQQVRLLGGNQGSSVSYANFSLLKWEIRGALWPN